MTLNGYVNQSMYVDIRMHSVLPPNAGHTVRFTGPMANPGDAFITPEAMTFNDTNWNTPQVLTIVPHRKGTIPIDYDITSIYTARHKVSSFNVHADDMPIDTFVSTGAYCGAQSAWYQLIGFVYFGGTGHTAPIIGGACLMVTPGGVISSVSTPAFTTAGIYSIYATSTLPFSAPGTETITITDASGTNGHNYTRLSFTSASGSYTLHSTPSTATPRAVNSAGPTVFTNVIGWEVTVVTGGATFGPGGSILSVEASATQSGDDWTAFFSGSFNPPATNYSPSANILGGLALQLVPKGVLLPGVSGYQGVSESISAGITNA